MLYYICRRLRAKYGREEIFRKLQGKYIDSAEPRGWLRVSVHKVACQRRQQRCLLGRAGVMVSPSDIGKEKVTGKVPVYI